MFRSLRALSLASLLLGVVPALAPALAQTGGQTTFMLAAGHTPRAVGTFATESVPALPAPSPSVSTPQQEQQPSTQAGLMLRPAVGTLLEYRVRVRAEVQDFRPDAWSLDPQVPDGVVAASLQNEGLLEGELWDEIRASFAAPIPDAKFFIRVLPPPRAGTVQLALTFIQPDTPERPGIRIRTLHTLNAQGQALAGQVRGDTRDARFLEALDPQMLWRLALGDAGWEPVGVYGPQAGGVQVVQSSGAAELALSGLLEGEEGVPEETPPVISVVQTRLTPPADAAAGRARGYWQVDQQSVSEPWATTLLWTQDSGDPVAAPYELRARTMTTTSRYRPDGLPLSSRQVTKERILLGLPSDAADPFQLVMHVGSRVTVEAELVRITP